MDDQRNVAEMSVGGTIWKQAMDRPYVVRATVGRVANELVGSYETLEEAREVADVHHDARILHAVSGEDLTDSVRPSP